MNKVIVTREGTQVIEMTEEEIEQAEKDRLAWEEEQAKPKPPTENDILGQRIVEQELQIMAMQTDNQVLGMQMTQKDLEIMQLQTDNQMLGQTVVGLEIRLSQGGM